MTTQGHLFFTISTSFLIQHFICSQFMHHDDWWRIIPISIITCLLPDIDHSKSIISKKLKYFSYIITKLFNHRGFTHSLCAIYLIYYILQIISNKIIFLKMDIQLGLIIGYCTHIIADIITPHGVLLLWPLKIRFKLPIITRHLFTEKFFCYIYFVFSVYLLYPGYNHILIQFCIKTYIKLLNNIY
ncbi:metal-dependent hydrolase [Enterobacteriaceae endosymbiont of Neohaemonia nigricornis]|uniref:metal-dependent hydrolase n=1 Tax=Enterobacteriaceae endosymbiont of Neohaemonia nigricornis TaxID=2675792 RepID=UPI00144941BC|nr:metal-dependent hydrolase [Enterobacteriaceae endosymbiont of Neohaemonia nigricornis]QJC30230.1 metal-dependent hydrolase [Enterobacteriaceae endosymbiont of Neohaemonia nigricornis]